MTPFDGLLDDAALFPPGEAPLAEAVPAHHGHHTASYAALVGPFVFPAPRLDELPAVLDDRPIELSVTIPAGPAELAGTLRTVSGIDGVRLVAVEVALPPGQSAARLVAALAEQLPAGVTGYVEVPRDERRESTLDELAGTGQRAKFRTGGVSAQAHPDERELAGAIVAAVTREIPFKCTAGLHHAVRHTDNATGFEQHGFGNVLLATDAARRGAGTAEVATLLAERSGPAVADGLRELTDGARSSFVSFGTCSVLDPVRDLSALGLLDQP
ncbi:hypothetical protein [Qaidamihabitans albus]|uniref:hypothetical protein n=1 Tax=Qaidamihabitans albus TaxID=2795733 RepID=UPI001F271D64|nr:hypothetical protein [Qaidamihabitans albus]